MREDVEGSSNDDFLKFKADYYVRIDVTYWHNRISECKRRYDEEIDESVKSECLIEIYSVYLQVIELFIINVAASTVPPYAFLPNIFTSNSEIVDLAKRFENTNDVKKYIASYSKPIIEMHAEKGLLIDAGVVIRQYETLLIEVAKDYLQDREMLNAYKHGFRVDFTSGDGNFSIGTKDKKYIVGTTNASIHYYSKSKEKVGELKGKVVAYDNLITFNALRIFGKAEFIYTLFENIVMREKQKARPKAKHGYRVFMLDTANDAWNTSYASFRTKQAIGYLEDLPKNQKSS